MGTHGGDVVGAGVMVDVEGFLDTTGSLDKIIATAREVPVDDEIVNRDEKDVVDSDWICEATVVADEGVKSKDFPLIIMTNLRPLPTATLTRISSPLCFAATVRAAMNRLLLIFLSEGEAEAAPSSSPGNGDPIEKVVLSEDSEKPMEPLKFL